MKEFKKIVQNYKQYEKIPESIDNKINNTLLFLEDKKVHRYRFTKYASIAAALVIVCSLVLLSKPSVAANIPLMGNIFKYFGSDINYSGDFENSTKLTKEDMKKGILSSEDSDIKFTVSEVYSDGYSVFLTMVVESEKYDFSKIKTRNNYQSICMRTSYAFGENVDKYDYDIALEGHNQGKHKFSGIMKFDMNDISDKNSFVNFKIITAYIDDIDEEKEINGVWNMVIPYKIDNTNSHEYEVNEKINDDIILKKLIMTKQQLIVASINNTDIEYSIAVFDQDGNSLGSYEKGDKEGKLYRNQFALKGKELSSVHIYIALGEDKYLDMINAETEEQAKQVASKEIDVDIK